MDGIHNFNTAALDHFQCHAGHPSARPKLMGVVGDAGRATTSYLIPSVLAAGGFPTGILGSLGAFDGSQWAAVPARRGTGAFALWIANVTANHCSHAVIEHCDRTILGDQLGGFALDLACFSDLGPGCFDSWTRRKQIGAILDCLAPEGFAIVNADDPAAEWLLEQIDGPVLTVGMRRAAEITATVVERWPGEQTFLLSTESETIPVRTRLLGDENVINCLLAAAVGTVYGIDLPAIVRGLEAIERMPDDAEIVEQTMFNRAA